MKKDLIIGAFDNYDYQQLAPWVNSIKMSGFTGDICLIAFNATYETAQKLGEKGVSVIALGDDPENKRYVHKSNIPVHVERFFHIYNVLSQVGREYNYIITTDVKDVIFQVNPSYMLKMMGDPQIVAATECMFYKDEPWGNQNLYQSFGPFFHDKFKDNEIYNVGVIAGWPDHVRDLCLEIFLMATNRPIPIVDQAVYNVLLSLTSWDEFYARPLMHDGWCVNLGTTSDPSKPEFLPLLTEEPPIIENDVVLTKNRDLICVVHQYDRVPGLKEAILKKYGEH